MVSDGSPRFSPGTDPVPTRRGTHVNLTVLCAVALLILAVSLFGGADSSSDASRPSNARHAPQAAPAAPSEEFSPPNGRRDSDSGRPEPGRSACSSPRSG